MLMMPTCLVLHLHLHSLHMAYACTRVVILSGLITA
jgi:hypothetical protein